MPAAKRFVSRSLKSPARTAACFLLLTPVLAQSVGGADLITDGYFNQVSRTAVNPVLTTLFGEFGTGTGATLTVAGWSTTGYNFVFAPGLGDAGTNTGANTGQPNEAPGQYANTSAGYGTEYLWGSKNGGNNTIGNYPAPNGTTANFLAADGAFQTGAITQNITGLTVGNSYNLTFYWAASQQQSFTGDLKENCNVTLGNQSFATKTVTLPSHNFSGWMQQTFTYTANAAAETLSFLAVGSNVDGTATSEPPFLLLGGVSLNAVPEPATWALCVGFGAAAMLFEVARRRRRTALDAPLD